MSKVCLPEKQPIRSYLLPVVWALTASGLLLMVGCTLRLMAVEGNYDPRFAWLVLGPPYLIFAMAAWQASSRRWLLIAVSVIGGFGLSSLTCAFVADTGLLGAMLGWKPPGPGHMNCAPPLIFLGVPFAYLTTGCAFVAGLASQALTSSASRKLL